MVSAGEEAQNFLVSFSSSELSSHQTPIRTCARAFLQAELSRDPALRVSRTNPPRLELINSLLEGLAKLAREVHL